MCHIAFCNLSNKTAKAQKLRREIAKDKSLTTFAALEKVVDTFETTNLIVEGAEESRKGRVRKVHSSKEEKNASTARHASSFKCYRCGGLNHT